MEREEIQKIVDQLSAQNEEAQASFGIFALNGGRDQSMIKANKAGLLAFIKALLRAAELSEKDRAAMTDTQIPLSYEAGWLDENSDTIIHFVELSDTPKASTQAKEIKFTDSILDRMIPFGCLLIVLLLLVAIIAGFWTLGKWLFS